MKTEKVRFSFKFKRELIEKSRAVEVLGMKMLLALQSPRSACIMKTLIDKQYMYSCALYYEYKQLFNRSFVYYLAELALWHF